MDSQQYDSQATDPHHSPVRPMHPNGRGASWFLLIIVSLFALASFLAAGYLLVTSIQLRILLDDEGVTIVSLEEERDGCFADLDACYAEQGDAPNGYYEDEWVSFSYPSSVVLEQLQTDETTVMEFLAMEGLGLYASTGYTLSYPVRLSDARHGATTFEELLLESRLRYESQGEVFELNNIEDRRYIRMIPFDAIDEDEIVFYFEGDTPETMYVLQGKDLYEPHADLTLITFLEQLQFINVISE